MKEIQKKQVNLNVAGITKSIYIPDDLHEKLKSVGKIDNRSVNNLIIHILCAYLRVDNNQLVSKIDEISKIRKKSKGGNSSFNSLVLEFIGNLIDLYLRSITKYPKITPYESI